MESRSLLIRHSVDSGLASQIFQVLSSQSRGSQWSRPCGDDIFQFGFNVSMCFGLCVSNHFIIIVMSRRLSFYDLWTWQWCNDSCMTTQPCRSSSVNSFYTFSKIPRNRFVQIQCMTSAECAQCQQCQPTNTRNHLLRKFNQQRIRTLSHRHHMLNEEQKNDEYSLIKWFLFLLCAY